MVHTWNFEELSEHYGVPVIDWQWMVSEGRWPGMRVAEIDLDDLPQGARYVATRHDVNEFEYHVFQYKGKLIAGRTYVELKPTAEDLAEWQATSSGCGYYTFIGQPWRD